VVGEGAREHAIAEALAGAEDRVYVLASYRNPGLANVAEHTGGQLILGSITSQSKVKEILRGTNPDIVVIGPEDPLFSGVSNTVKEEGIPVIGPSQRCAMIEGSKVWMRELMWKYKIPGRLRYRKFDSLSEAASFVRTIQGSIVVKPAEQVGGKGVKVITDLQAYLSDDKKTSVSSSLEEVSSVVKGKEKILVEEKVEGPEYTLHALSDGSSTIFLPLAQDYKNAFDYGVGPETGGMGSISGPNDGLPFIDSSELEASKEIVKSRLRSVELEAHERYVGFMGGQMMLTPIWGPTVIEFYSRMGDPETAAIVPRVHNFGDLLHLAAFGSLGKAKPEISQLPTVVKVLAPRGYPISRAMSTGHKIELDLRAIQEIGCRVYFGSISLEGGQLITQGSRTLEIVAEGDFVDASMRIERCVSMVKSDYPLFHRSDVGLTIPEQERLATISRRIYKFKSSNGTLGSLSEFIPQGDNW